MTTSPLLGFIDEVDVKSIQSSRRALRADLGSIVDLTASIKEKGLLQPIVVRPMEDGFEVVAGNRRLEACRHLKMAKIPCHVVELDDKEAYEVSLVENVQRRTLDPLEEAEAFRRYVDEYGHGSISDLARKIGKSPSYVSRRLSLLDLPVRAKKELVRRRISPSIAQELLSLGSEGADKMVALIGERHLSSRQVRKLVQHRAEDQIWRETSLPFLLSQHTYRSFERRMQRIDRALGRCIASLKMSLYRFGGVIEEAEDEWILRELLLQYRFGLNEDIGSLQRLKKKIRRLPPD